MRIKVYTDNFKEAIQTYEKNSSVTKEISSPLYLGYSAIALYKMGQKNKAVNLLNELKDRSKNSPVGSPSFFIAGVYTAMGNNDLAVQWLEKALSDKEVEMFWLKVEPIFKPLHNNPGFKNIINKIGYPK